MSSSKQVSLTQILRAEWSVIQSERSRGVLLRDIFKRLESDYQVERAYTTWSTTFNRLKKQLDDSPNRSPGMSPQNKPATPPPASQRKWSAKSNHSENPALAALRGNKK